MRKKGKAEAANFGQENHFTGSEIKAFSSLDYSGQLEPVQSILERMLIPSGKVIRCYQCLACRKSYAPARMSSLLIVCRECKREINEKGERAKRNQIERIKNQLGILLKRRLEVL